ncbi:BnaC06g31670D [Brassica napus]|uniref:BnaC06g31670D protein n=1 Tax=Brassica napus TaxID=3708 RepID=A0A078FF20_BRANA|nr:BnaC06g31670D [Brassica napus]
MTLHVVEAWVRER